MIPAQQLRCRIEKRELTTGLLVSSHLWPQLVEIAMAGGLDYLIADTEHLDHGAARIAEVGFGRNCRGWFLCNHEQLL